MHRRAFLQQLSLGLAGFCVLGTGICKGAAMNDAIRIFLCGDVMTGRGIDQIMPRPSSPNLYELYVRDAQVYVEIAEQVNGPIPRAVAYDYIWGDGLEVLREMTPDLRLINLETAVTTSENHWPDKGINYRMHPANVPCLSAADIDSCVLANNHVLDWGHDGLVETLGSLQDASISTVGAGRNAEEAVAPVLFDLPDRGRVILFAFGHSSSGTFETWRAAPDLPDVNILDDLSDHSVAEVARQVETVKREDDLVLLSIHWGGNWRCHIPGEQQRFAHRLIDTAGVDVIWGHSSHHPKGIEVYNGRPILYGCGDLISDYEDIKGEERYRGDLSLMYFLSLDPGTGRLLNLEMSPMQIRKFRLQHPAERDRSWLKQNLADQFTSLGTGLKDTGNGRFELIFH